MVFEAEWYRFEETRSDALRPEVPKTHDDQERHHPGQWRCFHAYLFVRDTFRQSIRPHRAPFRHLPEPPSVGRVIKNVFAANGEQRAVFIFSW